MEKTKGFSRAEFIVYCVFGAAAAAMLFPSVNLGLGSKGELGPGFIPFAAAVSVLVTSGLLVISILIKMVKGDPSAKLDRIGRKGWLRSGGILLSFALWPLLAGLIGYLISTFLVSLGLTKMVGYKGWSQPIVLGASITFCLWLIFGVLFDLDLPSGFSF